jgi:hypothetical protein
MRRFYQELATSHNAIARMMGDGFVSVSKTGNNIALSLNMDRILGQVPKTGKGNSSQYGIVRRALTKTDAGGSTTIQCDIYGQNDGVLATSGDEFNVTVHFNVVDGGGDANEAIPLLRQFEEVYITLLPNVGGSSDEWVCVWGLQPTIICTPESGA